MAVLKEAAKIGHYSLDFFATQSFDETGLGIPIAMQELFWGDAGIGLSIVGTGLAAAGVSSNGTPEQVGGHCCIERSEHDATVPHQSTRDGARCRRRRPVDPQPAASARPGHHGRACQRGLHDDLLDPGALRDRPAEGQLDWLRGDSRRLLARGLLGSLTAARLRVAFGYRLVTPGALLLGAVTMAGLYLTESAIVARVLLAGYILHVTVWNICVVSLRQRLVPEHLRGRQNSLFKLSGLVGLVLGAAVAGPIADAAGLAAPFGIAALLFAMCIAYTAWLLTNDSRLADGAG